MIEQVKDLWAFLNNKTDAVCITTNGFVKKDGCAVMGRGCALEATKRFPGIAHNLGNAIYSKGNIVHIIREIPKKDKQPLSIVSFPVKGILTKIESEDDFLKILPHYRSKFKIGRTVPGYMLEADIGLIRTSLKQLVSLTDEREWEAVVMPRPGCGYGGLDWKQIKLELELYLDDRFTVVHK